MYGINLAFMFLYMHGVLDMIHDECKVKTWSKGTPHCEVLVMLMLKAFYSSEVHANVKYS